MTFCAGTLHLNGSFYNIYNFNITMHTECNVNLNHYSVHGMGNLFFLSVLAYNLLQQQELLIK